MTDEQFKQLVGKLDKIVGLLEAVKANTTPFIDVVASSGEWARDTLTPDYIVTGDNSPIQSHTGGA